MEVFDTGIKILLFLTPIFAFIFFRLCVHWSEGKHPERRTKIGFLVSALYTFLFILGGLGLFFLISLILKLYQAFMKSSFI